MIVPTMTNLEICDALYADLPKLKIRAKTLIPRLSKQFNKEKKFPAWKWEEYTHQGSQNSYLISFYAPAPAYADNPIIKFIAFMEEDKQKYVIQWGCWPYRKFGSMEVRMIRAISYYRQHFFVRYRERVWGGGKDISYHELLCRYFSRNDVNIPIEMNEDIQRNYKKYGDLAAYSFHQTDGVCFIRHACEGDELSIGTENCNFIAVTLYMTIITNSMMSEYQKKAIGKKGRKYIFEFNQRLMKDAIQDTFSRRLIEKMNLQNNENAE